jgi:hypothetical protein
MPLERHYLSTENFAQYISHAENMGCPDEMPLHDRQTCEYFEPWGFASVRDSQQGQALHRSALRLSPVQLRPSPEAQ